MKKFFKIFIQILNIFMQFVSSFAASIVTSLIGMLIGRILGQYIGFFKFWSPNPAQSASIFFTILGISLGSMLGIMAFNKFHKLIIQYTIPWIATGIVFIYQLIYFQTHSFGGSSTTTMLFLPVTLTILVNLEAHFKISQIICKKHKYNK